MKNLLLGTAAIAGLVLASAPAAAQMELTIGGHSKNYVGYLDQDNVDTGVDMIRETELHFNGESTLDSGLTFGFQVETEVDGNDDDNTIEESYVYLSSGFGRLNLGSEDGAAYLLQIAAPSADSNIDGIRQYINPTANLDSVDYAQDVTGQSQKITYLSPNYSGLQFGASYTHDVDDSDDANASFNEDLEAGYEAAVRYEGVMNNFGYAFGAGYSYVENDTDDVNDADDLDAWNVGLDVDAGAFGIGVVYTDQDADTTESDALVVGVDYTTGAMKLGASYLTGEDDGDDVDRYTGGVVYTAGPGLSFRGSVSHLEDDNGGADDEATAVLGGVQINF
jgi:predicted porin